MQLTAVSYGQFDSIEFKAFYEKSISLEKINADSAMHYALKAVELADKDGDAHSKGDSHYQLSHLQKNRGEYVEAINNSFISLESFEKEDDYRGIVQATTLIGACYSLSRDNEMAKEYFIKAIKIGKEHNEIHTSSYIGLGNVYYYQDSIDEAEEIYIKAIDLLEKTGETSAAMTAGIFTNLGNIKFMQEDLEGANNFYFEALKIYSTIGNNMGICISSYNIGEVFYRLKNYSKAEEYFSNTLSLGKEINSIDDIEYALESLSDVYKAQNKFQKALEYSTMYHDFSDSVNQVSHQALVNEMELKYAKEKNESKLKQQEEEIQIAKIEKIRDDQYARFLFWGVISLGAIASVFLFSYLKIKNKNIIIEEAKQKIDTSLKEKEILLKEIHHRVKNNLQMISSLLNLQSYSLTNKDAIQALDESKNRVQAIALVHKKLYQDTEISKIDLLDYINDLCIWMGQFRSSDSKINFQLDIENIDLNVDTVVPLGLIISELLSNSQKHAFKEVESPEISITITEKENGQLLLLYADNGSGLPDDFSIENLNSLGFEIIEALTEQLNGNMTIGSKYGMFLQLEFKRV